MSLVKINTPSDYFHTAVQHGVLVQPYEAIDAYNETGELPHLNPTTGHEVDESETEHTNYIRYLENKALADAATLGNQYVLDFDIAVGKTWTTDASFLVFNIPANAKLTGHQRLISTTLPSQLVLSTTNADNDRSILAINVANFPLDLSAQNHSGTLTCTFTSSLPSYLGYVSQLTGVKSIYLQPASDYANYTHTYMPGLNFACACSTSVTFGNKYTLDASMCKLSAPTTTQRLYAESSVRFLKPPYNPLHTDYTNAFENSTFYTLDLSGFDLTGKTTTTMFAGCSNLQAIIAIGCNASTLSAINSAKPATCRVFTQELYIPPFTKHNWTIIRPLGGTPKFDVSSGELSLYTTATSGSSAAVLYAPVDYISQVNEDILAISEIRIPANAATQTASVFEFYTPSIHEPVSTLSNPSALVSGSYSNLPKGQWAVASWITQHKRATGSTGNFVTIGTLLPDSYSTDPIRYRNYHIYLP